MCEKEIKDKLQKKLSSIPETEEDVVYVLSRIRKIFEINSRPSEFAILNFYCNLTLHTKITRPPKVVVKKLKEIQNGTGDYPRTFFDVTLNDFHKQLDEFCKRYGFQSFYSNKKTRLEPFNNLLIDVWSHTPIRIEYVEGFNFTISRTEEGIIIMDREPV
jgi:predicted nucleic-acid-binding Zn-ribbon protein